MKTANSERLIADDEEIKPFEWRIEKSRKLVIFILQQTSRKYHISI